MVRTAAFAVLTILGIAVAKGGPSLAVTFDDLQGDALQSDGGGAYDAGFKGRWDEFVMMTGSRDLFLDFSEPTTENFDTPFLGASTGWIDGATMTIQSLNFGPGNGLLNGTIEFQAPAPDGSGPTSWVLQLQGTSSRVDDDGDGSTDHWELNGETCGLIWWKADPTKEPGRGNAFKAAGNWETAGRYAFPWGALVER